MQWHIIFNRAAAVRASEKRFNYRQYAFHRTIDEPCALPLSPAKGVLKREFQHLALPFYFFVAGNR